MAHVKPVETHGAVHFFRYFISLCDLGFLGGLLCVSRCRSSNLPRLLAPGKDLVYFVIRVSTLIQKWVAFVYF